MDHVVAYFVGGQREKYLFNIRCLKLYQFERITWWCLFVLEFVLEYALQSVLKHVMLGKNIKKNHDFPELVPCPLLRGGPDKNSGRP
jgi:hypothetical protein